MKKCLVWLLAAALLLAGCGKKAASQAESLRQRYREMQAAHMEAEITCHLETENRTFTVSCDWTPTGAGTTVTGPEDLAGLTASVSGEDLTVSYDGAALSALDCSMSRLMETVSTVASLKRSTMRLILDASSARTIMSTIPSAERSLPRRAQ